MSGPCAQKIDDLGQPALRNILWPRAVLRVRKGHPPIVSEERFENLGDRKH